MKVTRADLFDMALHDKATLDDGTEILRVMEGWVYTRFHPNWVRSGDGVCCDEYIPTSVFVPSTHSEL